MNKKILYSLLAISGVGILLWTLIPISNKIDTTNSIGIVASHSSSADQIKISFSISHAHEKKQKSSKKPLYLEKKVKYATEDLARKYRILLIDENPQNTDVTIEHGYKSVIGTIDGSRFVLKVPRKSLESGVLKLVVIDKRSDKKKEIDAEFLQELNTLDTQQEYHINLKFNDIKNYNTSVFEKRAILPTP